MDYLIEGVKLIPLKQIYHPKGDVFHAMKKSDVGFNGFGEVYFSSIIENEIKPWKKHTQMTLNFVVPLGEIQFVIYDDRKDSTTFGMFNSFVLSPQNYCRLTIPPNLWVAFKGVSSTLNLLLNIADMEHDPNEIIRLGIDDIQYDWR